MKYPGGVVASVVIFNEAFANGRDCAGVKDRWKDIPFLFIKGK